MVPGINEQAHSLINIPLTKGINIYQAALDYHTDESSGVKGSDVDMTIQIDYTAEG